MRTALRVLQLVGLGLFVGLSVAVCLLLLILTFAPGQYGGG